MKEWGKKERKKERSYKEWGNMKIERMGKERKKEATKNGKMRRKNGERKKEGKKLQRMGKYED